MKKFYILILTFLLFFITGCNSISNNDIEKYENKITELEEKISNLEAQITQKNNEISEKDNKISELTEKLKNSSIKYTVSVYDIDGEELANKDIIGKDGDKLVDVLKNNFDTIITQSEWGSSIVSIEGSIIDPNYYLACYVNDEYALVGADELVLHDNDKVKYVSECWNTEFDETDKLVDKIVYKFVKNELKNIYEKISSSSKTPFYDYYLTASIMMMKKLGYDQRYFNFNFENAGSIKTVLENKDWESETVQNNFMKGGITMLALGADMTAFKTALNKQAKYNYWQTIVAKALDIENDILKTTIDSFEIPTKADDSSLMAVTAYSLFMTKDEIGTSLIDETYKNLTENGIDCWGVNGASTAQFIIALCSLGLNPRNYTVDLENNLKIDSIEIMAKYAYENGLKYTLSNDKIDLAYTTPQGITAFLLYKVMRDNKLSSANCFSYLS